MRWGYEDYCYDLASGELLPGQYFDEETNLHYNYFRYYDPETGRYLRSDPIGILEDFSDPQLQVAYKIFGLDKADFFDGTLNHPYGYAEQNPLIYNDPNGLYVGVIFKAIRWILQKVKPKPKAKPKPKEKPWQCPPDRRKRCEEAFWRCMADTSVSEGLCIAAQTQCVTSPLPTLFPHGEWVK